MSGYVDLGIRGLGEERAQALPTMPTHIKVDSSVQPNLVVHGRVLGRHGGSLAVLSGQPQPLQHTRQIILSSMAMAMHMSQPEHLFEQTQSPGSLIVEMGLAESTAFC